MKRRPIIYIAIVAVPVFAGVFIWRFVTTPPFAGEMRVAEGQVSAMALQPTTLEADAPAKQSADMVLGVKGSDLVGAVRDLPEGWLNAEHRYDVVTLPFTVRLDRVEVTNQTASKPLLRIGPPGGEVPTSVNIGDTIEVGDAEVRVVETRPWRGVLPETGGLAVVSCAVRDGDDWIEPVLVGEGGWASVGTSVAVHALWCEDENEAGRILETGLNGLQAMRWGVRDGGRILWMNSLTPGTGMDLEDGRSVTLQSYEPGVSGAPSHITVEIAGPDGRSVVQPTVNDVDETSPVMFQDLTLMPHVFVVCVHGRDRATVGRFENGALQFQGALQRGYQLETDGNVPSFRLDRALSQAVVPDGAGTWSGIWLETGSRLLSVREGETIEIAGDLVTFEEAAPPPDVTYHLTISENDGESIRVVQLDADTAIRVGDWTLKQGVVVKGAPTARLLVDRTTFGGWDPKLLVIAIIAVVAFDMFSVGRWGKPRSGQSESN